jgi:hypothetical protein
VFTSKGESFTAGATGGSEDETAVVCAKSCGRARAATRAMKKRGELSGVQDFMAVKMMMKN